MKNKNKDLSVTEFWEYTDKILSELSETDLEALENLLKKERMKRNENS